MAASWQGPHYIVLLGASALAFAVGYNLGGGSGPQVTAAPPPGNGSNGLTPVIGAGADANGQQGPRARPDENELIARNAEVEEGVQPPRGNIEGGEDPRGGERGARRERESRRDEVDPVDEVFEDREQDGYGPERE